MNRRFVTSSTDEVFYCKIVNSRRYYTIDVLFIKWYCIDDYRTPGGTMSTGTEIFLVFVVLAILYGILLILSFKIYYRYFYKPSPSQSEIARKLKDRSDWGNRHYKEAQEHYWQICKTADEMLNRGEITAAQCEQIKKDAKNELNIAIKTAFG